MTLPNGYAQMKKRGIIVFLQEGDLMGFSPAGTLIACAIVVPSICFAILFPPRDLPKQRARPHILLQVLNRVGQAACPLALIFSGECFERAGVNFWSLIMILCIALYYATWIRYFSGGRRYRLLLNPMGIVPIPLAVFPIGAFFFAGIWGWCLPLLIAAAVLGVGQCGVSWQKYQDIR